MSSGISLFPTLNDDLRNKFRFEESDFSFYYFRDDEKFNLKAEPMEGSESVYKLLDDEGIWTPDDYNLCISKNYSLRTYQCLFGENGIACQDAVLGLALMWKSQDSKQRGVIPIGDIKNSGQDLDFKLEYNFGVAQLRGNVEFTTIIYLKTAGTPLENEEYLANEYGCLLGELDNFSVQLDGIGSIFPIYEVTEPSQPLWYVKCDWDDPNYDQFSDSVSININKANANYKYVDKTNKSFNEQLLKEIISSALVIIVAKFRKDQVAWNSINSGEQFEKGSVSEAISYFIETLGWDVSSYETLSLSIRKFFDQRI